VHQHFTASLIRKTLDVFVIAALLAGVALSPVPVAYAATFTVDNAGDAGDANPGNGSCATAGGVCTLRAAIEESNALAAGAPHNIHFNIGGGGVQTISPGSTLPDIDRSVTIDGTTQPGFSGTPIIELNGSGAADAQFGLEIHAGSSIVRGLVINRFPIGGGIWLRSLGGNTIEGCYIGTDVNGTANMGNYGTGVEIDDVPNNTIGGATAGAKNAISCSQDGHGVGIRGSNATGNKVLGNYIGTDVNGTADLGNISTGVDIREASDNTVGGTEAGARNIISGNDFLGIDIVGVSRNQVLGNYIGADVNGTAAIGNGGGISIYGGSDNIIGGTEAGARNIILGNLNAGVGINGGGGNKVLGNYIGTDVNGTADLGNGGSGVSIAGLESSPCSTIGGSTAGAGNVISGNGGYGIEIYRCGSYTCFYQYQVQGNYIGANAAGTASLPNDNDGVYLQGTCDIAIGGTEAGAGNVISGNGANGLHIESSVSPGSIVQGNYIGTNASGTAALGNATNGVFIEDGSNSYFGGGWCRAKKRDLRQRRERRKNLWHEFHREYPLWQLYRRRRQWHSRSW